MKTHNAVDISGIPFEEILFMYTNTISLTPPLLVQVHRKPPSVIPYHRHKEGKQKLAEILKLQNFGEPKTGNLVTPPGTPR